VGFELRTRKDKTEQHCRLAVYKRGADCTSFEQKLEFWVFSAIVVLVLSGGQVISSRRLSEEGKRMMFCSKVARR
jgi:hypothetical protein